MNHIKNMINDFRIFDSHTHLGHGLHHGRRCSSEQLLAAMDEHGVERSLVIPFPVVADHYETHNEIARAVKAHPARLVGVACLYPYIGREKYRDEIKRCAEELGFRALKLQPQFQPLDPLLEIGDFLYETAIEFNLPIVIHTGSGIPYSLPSLYIMPAKRFPEAKIVLAHCGGGGLFFGEAIIAAMTCENIWLELSTLLPHQILLVLKHVKASRLMVGSDLPENVAAELTKIINLEVADEIKQDILWNTACHLFGEGC
jgi:hypothetical protein